MTQKQLEKRVKFLSFYAMGSTLLIALLFIGAFTFQNDKRFDEITVERINIVNPDGKLAMVLANFHRLPGPIFQGREYFAERRKGIAGMIFYNGHGNEIGGLTYALNLEDSTFRAFRHLSFDQYKQDQVLVLQYRQTPKNNYVGIALNHRPTDVTILEVIERLKAIRNASGKKLKQAKQWLSQLKEETFTRISLATVNKKAQLAMTDTEGRTRILLYVDSLDVPHLKFFNKKGEVIYSIPPRQ